MGHGFHHYVKQPDANLTIPSANQTWLAGKYPIYVNNCPIQKHMLFADFPSYHPPFLGESPIINK